MRLLRLLLLGLGEVLVLGLVLVVPVVLLAPVLLVVGPLLAVWFRISLTGLLYRREVSTSCDGHTENTLQWRI